MIVARYELVVHGPADFDPVRTIELQRLLPGLLRETEENLTIMLPLDFHITIEKKEAE